MTGIYPLAEAIVVAACLAIVLFVGAIVARRRGLPEGMAWSGLGLLWWLGVWQLARSGIFEGVRAGARGAALLVIAAPLAGAVAALASRRSTVVTDLADPAELVGVQVYRVAALVVLLAFAGKALPGWLALPIGSAEVVLGLGAPVVARSWRRGARRAGAMVTAWTCAGAASATFTVVASLAAAHTSGYFLTLYPLVLFPTFLAPGSLVLHLTTWRRLAAARRRG